jgi:hypothetical protein
MPCHAVGPRLREPGQGTGDLGAPCGTEPVAVGCGRGRGHRPEVLGRRGGEGHDLRRDICREIRRFKPDVVLGAGHEIETPYGFDQADHRAAGLATLDAVRDAGNRWVFPEQVDDDPRTALRALAHRPRACRLRRDPRRRGHG